MIQADTLRGVNRIVPADSRLDELWRQLAVAQVDSYIKLTGGAIIRVCPGEFAAAYVHRSATDFMKQFIIFGARARKVMPWLDRAGESVEVGEYLGKVWRKRAESELVSQTDQGQLFGGEVHP